jgi:Eukaryotic aspartyl protease
MLGTTIAVLAIALLIPSHVEGVKVSISHPAASREAFPLAVSNHVLNLTRTKLANGINPRSAASLFGVAKIPSSKHIATLTSVSLGEAFSTEISFGTETFLALVDTGSSNTWMIGKGFQCAGLDSLPQTEAVCAFGPTYKPSKTFVKIPDENFNITYGDGSYLNGILGTEKVTLAGLKLKQTVAVADFAAWEGDGVSSGIIGLAYPDL